jgi:hypothetical protein
MKKGIFVLLLLLIPLQLFAQVFGTGQTLKKGGISIGVNPAAYSKSNVNDFYLFLHGGYGIARGVDFGIRVGLLGEETYFGADLEWVLHRKSPYISITAGAHSFYDFGLDGTINLTFPVAHQFNIYTGVDLDLNFPESDTSLPLWLFVGGEVMVARKIALLIEVEAGLNDDASNIFSGGFNFYL